MAKQSKKSYQVLSVVGTPLMVQVTVPNLRSSDAGKNEIGFKNACLLHKRVCSSPRTCSECGAGNDVAQPGSAFEIRAPNKSGEGGEYLFFTKEEVESKRPKRDGELRVVRIVPASEVGFSVSTPMAAVITQAYDVVPNMDRAQRKMYSAIAAGLGQEYVGIVEMVGRTFKYALLRVDENGQILLHVLVKPEATKMKEAVELVELSEKEAKLTQALFARLAEGQSLDDGLLDQDPYAAEMRAMILAREAGEVVEVTPVEASRESDVDLEALLGA